jgi:hypothetical protein
MFPGLFVPPTGRPLAEGQSRHNDNELNSCSATQADLKTANQGRASHGLGGSVLGRDFICCNYSTQAAAERLAQSQVRAGFVISRRAQEPAGDGGSQGSRGDPVNRAEAFQSADVHHMIWPGI